MALARIMIIDYVTQLKKKEEEITQAITQVDSASFWLPPPYNSLQIN